MIDPRTDVRDPGRIAALWTGVLLAPTAFMISLALGYVLVQPSCAQGTTLPVHGAHAACLALALLGVVVAWRCWHEEGHEWPGESGGAGARSRFLAGLGLAHSGLFVLVLAAQWVPTLALHPCL